MLQASDPPVNGMTAVTAYMDETTLAKMHLALSADKIKKVLGFQLKHPRFNKEELKVIVDRWKEEGSWPRVEPKSSST